MNPFDIIELEEKQTTVRDIIARLDACAALRSKIRTTIDLCDYDKALLLDLIQNEQTRLYNCPVSQGNEGGYI